MIRRSFLAACVAALLPTRPAKAAPARPLCRVTRRIDADFIEAIPVRAIRIPSPCGNPRMGTFRYETIGGPFRTLGPAHAAPGLYAHYRTVGPGCHELA